MMQDSGNIVRWICKMQEISHVYALDIFDDSLDNKNISDKLLESVVAY